MSSIFPQRFIFPQYDYGQKSGAWNPSSGALIYRQMERARFDAAFALIFCVDIMFGKERSGDACWIWVKKTETGTDENGDTYIVRTWFEREKHETRGEEGGGWLYNDNTLNASRSGVPQAFGPPAAKVDGTWRYAVPCTTRGTDPLPSGVPQFTFVVESAIADAHFCRMLDAAHVAFAAIDHFGTLVCVPYARNREPLKQRRGRPECGDGKLSPINRFYK